MCGITWYRSKDKKSSKILQDSIDTIKHRGPNDDWFFVQDNKYGEIWFWHVRLSIIDISPAWHQPMWYDKTLWAFSHTHKSELIESYSTTAVSIIFNGEIYNFGEVKEELSQKWYVFSTHSDTEVILASYIQWGEKCVDKFNGMRAFSIYDPSKNILFLSRDVLWEKPLYYYQDDKQFIRGSEIKTILKHTIKTEIDKEAVDFYFTLWYIPSPWSIYKNIRKLPANHNMTFDLSTHKLSLYSYYEKPEYAPIFDKEQLIKTGKELLQSSVEYRMFSDVPVGAFLSGWLDSSSVVADMTKYTKKDDLHTFSIWFEGKYDETEYVDIVKNYLGTNHHHAYFKQDDFEKMIDTMYYYYDEPFADYSNFPTRFVCELAKDYVTVALSGDGWDEIFGGYTMHQVAAQMEILYAFPTWLKKLWYRSIPKTSNNLSLLSKLKEAFRVSLLPQEDFYAELWGTSLVKPRIYKDWTRAKLQELLTINKWNFVQSIIDFDLYYNTLWDNFLHKVDRASMCVALETRPPLLDKRLISYAHTIPTKRKVSLRQTKILMRDIIIDMLPKKIVYRGKKWFQPPLDKRILQDAYTEFMQKWLQTLMDAWIVNKTWWDFYKEHVFTQSNTIFNTYKIRLFLLLKRYKIWMQ